MRSSQWGCQQPPLLADDDKTYKPWALAGIDGFSKYAPPGCAYSYQVLDMWVHRSAVHHPILGRFSLALERAKGLPALPFSMAVE